MATLKTRSRTRDIAPGSSLMDVSEALGVPFGCRKGICGTCKVTILAGEENLSPRSEMEEEYDLGAGERLACQCTVTDGLVQLDVD